MPESAEEVGDGSSLLEQQRLTLPLAVHALIASITGALLGFDLCIAGAILTPVQRALVLLAVRTDCTITGLQEVIASKLGKEFLEPPTFNLEKSFNDSTISRP